MACIIALVGFVCLFALPTRDLAVYICLSFVYTYFPPFFLLSRHDSVSVWFDEPADLRVLSQQPAPLRLHPAFIRGFRLHSICSSITHWCVNRPRRITLGSPHALPRSPLRNHLLRLQHPKPLPRFFQPPLRSSKQQLHPPHLGSALQIKGY